MSASLPLYFHSPPTSPAPHHTAHHDPSSADPSPPAAALAASHLDLDLDPRLSFPASVHTLALDAPPTQPGLARRDSFRPPLPPKPVLPGRGGSGGSGGSGGGTVGMERSRSAEATASALGTAKASPLVGGSPALSDGAASSRSSPGKWMSAMLDGGTDSDADGGEAGGDERRRLYGLLDGVGLGIPSGSRTPGAGRSGASTPIIGSSGHLPFPARSKEPPAVPPRPGKLSSPPLQPTPTFHVGPTNLAYEQPMSPSSAPPSLSPFLAASSSLQSHAPPSAHLSTHGPPPARSRPGASTPSSSSTPSSGAGASTAAGTVFSAVNRGLQHANLGKRFGAGVGFAREWGGKGKIRVQEGWRGLGSGRPGTAEGANGMPESASSPQLDGGGARLPHSPSMPLAAFQPSSTPTSAAPSSSTSTPAGGIKLPAIILNTRVPNVRNQAFGVPLAPLVASTRAPPPPFHTPQSADEVTGTSARLYLPAIAFRSLEYLSLWGPREEGIYRIPGRSVMVAQLRAMYDAGVGGEVDLREIHPGDLDPHAVASCWKGWLRELPESLLSPTLEPLIDALTVQHLGYSASSSSFLGSTTSSASSSASSSAAAAGGPTPATPVGPTGVVSGTPLVAGAAGGGGAAAGGAAGGGGGEHRAPREYCEQLREVFAMRMEPENWHLLRAIAYHLARLSSASATNKMTLTNLRLILSPTLRLTPGFLQVLVVEREILFSKANEATRQRQAAASNLSTPPLPQSSTFAPSSPSSGSNAGGRTSSPLLYARPLSPNLAPSSATGTHSPRQPTSSLPATLPHSRSGGSDRSWLVVEEMAAAATTAAAEDAGRSLSPTFSPSFSTTSPEPLSPPPSSSSASFAHSAIPLPLPRQRSSPQTPIADRFASTSTSSAPTSSSTSLPSGLSKPASNLSLRETSPSPSSSAAALPVVAKAKPAFIPSRDRANGAGGGGFFGSGTPAGPAPSGGGGRKASGGSGRKASLTPSIGEEAAAVDERPTLDSVKVEEGRLSLGGFEEAFGRAAGGLAPFGGAGPGASKAEVPAEDEEQERLADPSSAEFAVDSETAAAAAAGEHAREGRRRSSGGSSVQSLRRGRRSSSSSSSAGGSVGSSALSVGGSAAGAGAVAGRPTTMDLTLPMPAGLGVGVGAGMGMGMGIGLGFATAPSSAVVDGTGVGEKGEERDGDGWGLLSVEERRKFFGG